MERRGKEGKDGEGGERKGEQNSEGEGRAHEQFSRSLTKYVKSSLSPQSIVPTERWYTWHHNQCGCTLLRSIPSAGKVEERGEVEG